MLLVLFIFIFSILGLQQFGGAAAFAPAPPAVGYNPNFDTLWQSGYTVFQLLTSKSTTQRYHAASFVRHPYTPTALTHCGCRE